MPASQAERGGAATGARRIPLTRDSIVVRSDGMVAADVEDEIIGLDMASGSYFAFNRMGSRLWRALAEPRRVGDLCAELESEFRVSPEVCEADVLRMLGGLQDEGLVLALPDAPGD